MAQARIDELERTLRLVDACLRQILACDPHDSHGVFNTLRAISDKCKEVLGGNDTDGNHNSGAAADVE